MRFSSRPTIWWARRRSELGWLSSQNPYPAPMSSRTTNAAAMIVAASPALPAQDEHGESGGEEREEEQVGEGVLEDHGDEHQRVRHAALLQHAVRDGRAADAAGGEEVGGGQPGQVDAQRQAERDRPLQQAEQAAEQQGVEEEGDALHGDRHDQPGGGGVLDELDRVRLPGEARHDEEQRHDDHEEDDRRAPGVAAARCGGVAQRFFLPPRRWRDPACPDAARLCRPALRATGVAQHLTLDLPAADPGVGHARGHAGEGDDAQDEPAPATGPEGDEQAVDERGRPADQEDEAADGVHGLRDEGHLERAGEDLEQQHDERDRREEEEVGDAAELEPRRLVDLRAGRVLVVLDEVEQAHPSPRCVWRSPAGHEPGDAVTE